MGLDDVLRALSDPTRREVVRVLGRSGPMTAGELADLFPLAKSTMSGHFAVLKQAGLIVSERQGTQIRYSARASVLEEAMSAVMEQLGVGEEAAVADAAGATDAAGTGSADELDALGRESGDGDVR